MTAAVPMLEDSLVWLRTGHLAEPAIAALADGEGAFLPQQAMHHAATCAACSERLGLAALFAVEVADAVRAAALAREPAPAARVAVATHEAPRSARSAALPSLAPVPKMLPAVFVALALAAGTPLLLTLRASSPAHVLARVAHFLAQAAVAARAPGVDALRWFAAALLLVAGGLVARSAARARLELRAGLP